MRKHPAFPIEARVALAFTVMFTLLAPRAADAYPRPGTTERVSVASDGTQGNDLCGSPAISTDGRLAVFFSYSSNFVDGDSNSTFDTFVRDRLQRRTELISLAADGGTPPFGATSVAGGSMSEDGRYVVITSQSPALVADDTNAHWDVFVRDRIAEATERVSLTNEGAQGSGGTIGSVVPRISGDGRYVSFQSDETNLVSGDTNGVRDVFVRDLVAKTTERVSLSSQQEQANAECTQPVICADGRYIAFESTATNLVAGDNNAQSDVFLYDRVAHTTERISIAGDGSQANARSAAASISADGQRIAFGSTATNLVPVDGNGGVNPQGGTFDTFIRDRASGETRRAGVAADGREIASGAESGAISPDGRFVVFRSGDANVVPGDTNGQSDLFIHDLVTAMTERVTITANGGQAGGGAFGPAMPSVSAGGREIVFLSHQTNLVADDTNGQSDIFVRDRGQPLGIGALSVVPQENQLSVSGWATFSGATISSATDPAGDGNVQGEDVGADLVDASLIYRPESGDLLVRLRLAFLSSSDNGVLYGLRFNVGAVQYEVRALRAGATAVPPTPSSFELYRCDPTCTQHATLSGSIGSTGREVLVSTPLSALSALEGAALTEIQAFTAVGLVPTGTASPVDQTDLANATIPARQVSFGTAPKGTPASQVPFDRTASLTDGSFLGMVELSALPSGPYDVWARACLGLTCGPAVSWPRAAPLVRVASRKAHASAGTFEINLPLTGNPGVECRTSGANGDYTLVFSFAHPLASVGLATVSSGTGTVSSSAIGPDAHQYVVSLTGVANAQVITVNLSNVNDSAGNSSEAVSIAMRVLVGDTTASGSVNSTDISQTKSQSGQTVSASNFRQDVTVNGAINSSDISLVKSKSGTALP